MKYRENDAAGLAAIIRAYWQARGHYPLVRIERQHADASRTDNRAVYVVRSDMLGGWPRAVAVAGSPILVPNINSGLTARTDSQFGVLAGMLQRKTTPPAVGLSNRLSGEAGLGAG